MFKQPITYTDFNGVERTEDFYFHLSLPELTRLEVKLGSPIGEYAKRIASEQNVSELVDFVENIILNSYGRKTADGKSFYKSEELRKEFEHSQAYAEMFEMMIKDNDLARRFGEGVADKRSRKSQNVQEVK